MTGQKRDSEPCAFRLCSVSLWANLSLEITRPQRLLYYSLCHSKMQILDQLRAPFVVSTEGVARGCRSMKWKFRLPSLSVCLSVSSLQSYVFLSFGPSEVVFARETAFIRRQGKGGKIGGESP